MSADGHALGRPATRLALFAALAVLSRAPFLTVPFLDLDEAAALVRQQAILWLPAVAVVVCRGGPGRTNEDSLSRDDHWDLLMEDLERNEPVFILDTAPAGLHGWDRYPMTAFPRLERFLRDSYRAVAAVDGIWIWRRQGCEREHTPTR